MENSIDFQQENSVGIIQLNSPKTLNTLKLKMIKAMIEKFEDWENNEEIKAVILEGIGNRAFCAGGNVVSLFKEAAHDKTYIEEFFTNEYKLDLMIHRFKKPILCLGDGIVMGGGIGIMNGCSHRVVTQKTLMAMPEITIGLFPDVGATSFLNKMPGNSGLFLGLTGAKLNPNDALFLSLADFLMDSNNLAFLKKEVLKTGWSPNNKENHNILTRISEKFCYNSNNLPPSQVKTNIEKINQITDFSNIHQLDDHWRNYKLSDDWISQALKTYLKGSPTSAAVIFKQIQEGKTLSLGEVFKKELVMAKQFSKQHDFKEGVRALLVDKDNAPRWNPSSLKEVTPEIVTRHFEEV